MPETFRALKELPIIGDYVAYERDRLGFLMHCFKTQGTVVRYNDLVYMLGGNTLCEQVLMRTNQDFVTPDFDTVAGLTSLHYDMERIIEEWKINRVGLVQGLHRRTIAPHFEQMFTIITSFLANWKPGQIISVFDKMRHLASQVTVNYLFGPRGYQHLKTFHRYLDAHFDWLNSSFVFPPWLPTPLSLRWHAGKKELARALQELIQQEHIEGSESPNLLSLLMQTPDKQGNQFSDNHIQGVLNAVLFQSAHTTYATLSWIWFLLALYPEQEEKMYQEIQQVLGDRQPEFQDLSQLVYTEGVVKETLRLYPPLWQLTRDVARNCYLGEYICEEGQRFYLNLYHVHHDARLFPNPEAFQPERWLQKGEARAEIKGIYIPFGLGSRKCLGASFAMAEVLLITVLIARRFKLRLENGARVTISPDIVLRPKNLRLRLEERFPR